MANYTTILVEEKEVETGRVLTITLNRPQRRNALTSAMIHELTLALRAAEDSPAGVVVLRGEGEHFCSGLDLSELRAMAGRTREQHQLDSMNIAELFRTLYSLSIPSIAEVRGFALAGGMGLATLCDFTLAADDARLGYTEVKIGFVPAIVSSFLLLQVGEKQARDLLLTGRILDAAEARTLGLITKVVPAARTRRRRHGAIHIPARQQPQLHARHQAPPAPPGDRAPQPQPARRCQHQR